MIPKYIVDNYLNRKLQNWDWIKGYSNDDLTKFIESEVGDIGIKYDLFKHQKEAYILGLQNPQFFYMLDMGGGKCVLTISNFKYRKNIGECHRGLVLVPKSVHLYTWEDEVKKFTDDLSIVPLDDTTKGRAELLDNKTPDLFVLNYPGLVYLCTDYINFINKKGKNEGRQLINPKKVRWLASKFDFLACDESQNFKGFGSLTYKILNMLADNIEYRYLLSGTPMGLDPHDLWTQFNIVDRGETLGNTLGIFRESFFTTKRNHWGGFEYKFKKKLEPKFNEFIKNKSIWYSSEEFGDLPPQIFSIKRVSFNEDCRKYYKKAVEDIIAVKGDVTELKNVFIQMRMMTSGFIGLKNELSGEKVNITFKDNPKLEALMELINETPKDSKIIVFNEFIHSGDIISKELTKNKIGHVRLYSGTKDAKGLLESFNGNKNCRILLANNKSGSEGINAFAANYIFYYELPLSCITYKQGLKRIHRFGQTKTCYYYAILMKNSVDEKIYKYLQEGKEIFDAIISGEEKLDGLSS
jgi:SNF2 family DNA or RNA helicase